MTKKRRQRERNRAANLSFIEGKLSGNQSLSQSQRTMLARQFRDTHSDNVNLSDPQYADEVSQLVSVSGTNR